MYNSVQPFLVALYYGTEKPQSVDDYLAELLQELKLLQVNGLYFDRQHFSVSVSNFICDAPARAFLKCTKIHNDRIAAGSRVIVGCIERVNALYM